MDNLIHRRTIYWLLLSFIVVLLSGCSRTTVSYRPPLLPVKLVIDDRGNVSVVGEVSLVTFVGEFSVGAEYTLKSESDTILVIIRDRKKGAHGADTIYRVQTQGDEFVAILNGKTVVQVTEGQVLIDITGAKVESIEFKRAEGTIVRTSRGFWNDAYYHPFKITEWVMEQHSFLWGAAGFVLFLAELTILPFMFVIRVCSLLFGRIGGYGAFVILWLALVGIVAISDMDTEEGCWVAAIVGWIILAFLIALVMSARFING